MAAAAGAGGRRCELPRSSCATAEARLAMQDRRARRSSFCGPPWEWRGPKEMAMQGGLDAGDHLFGSADGRRTHEGVRDGQRHRAEAQHGEPAEDAARAHRGVCWTALVVSGRRRGRWERLAGTAW